jgi:hypothetical protein
MVISMMATHRTILAERGLTVPCLDTPVHRP